MPKENGFIVLLYNFLSGKLHVQPVALNLQLHLPPYFYKRREVPFELQLIGHGIVTNKLLFTYKNGNMASI